MNDKKRKIIIAIGASIATLMLIAGVVAWILSAGDGEVKKQPAHTVKTDPITGETIVSPEGVDPETSATNGRVDPMILGANNVQPLFGNDIAFTAVKNDVLLEHFKDAIYIKISPKNIIKKAVSNEQTSEYYLLIEFDVYLDSNTTDKYRVSVKSQYDGIIPSSVTGPDGIVTNYTTSIYGSD